MSRICTSGSPTCWAQKQVGLLSGVVVDTHGNVGVYNTVGGGGAISTSGLGAFPNQTSGYPFKNIAPTEGGVDASIGLSVGFSNAKNINDLAGPFINGSVGGGEGVHGSVDGFTGSSPDGTVFGGGVTVGGGGGTGGGGSVVTTTTTITPFWGPGSGGSGTRDGGAVIELANQRRVAIMSIREMVKHPPMISDLPLGRKIVIAVALGFVMVVGAVGINEHLTIYGSAPNHPVPSTGQVYAVDVMHGYIRYVTASEKDSFDLRAGRAGSWAGAAFVGAFFLWITYRKKTTSRSR